MLHLLFLRDCHIQTVAVGGGGGLAGGTSAAGPVAGASDGGITGDGAATDVACETGG